MRSVGGRSLFQTSPIAKFLALAGVATVGAAVSVEAVASV
jgi:hypothetical protein